MLAALAIALWLLREILLPFVLGMVIGYLLDPLVERLGRRGVLPRRRGGRYGRLPERTRFRWTLVWAIERPDGIGAIDE